MLKGFNSSEFLELSYFKKQKRKTTVEFNPELATNTLLAFLAQLFGITAE